MVTDDDKIVCVARCVHISELDWCCADADIDRVEATKLVDERDYAVTVRNGIQDPAIGSKPADSCGRPRVAAVAGGGASAGAVATVVADLAGTILKS